MMNTKKSKIALLLAASALSMALTGCGSDGKNGPDGTPGTPGGEPAGAIKQVNIQFTNVAIKDGLPRVEFFATNEDNLPIVGMQYFSFHSEQLVPEGLDAKLNPQPGESSVWQYLLNETCNIKANSCSGTFVDHKNGHYSYTFAANLKTSTRATYDSQLAHRIVINNRIRNSDPTPLPDNTALPIFTGIYDFMPNTGAAADYSRKIVTTASCNACHQDVINAYHYTSDVNFCSSCHTTNRVSAGREFNALIHTKHKDVKLDALNSCESCHVESEDAPDWSNWSRIPTATSCGSCHTGIDFAAGKGHSQQLDNSNCVACHNNEWTTEIHTGKAAATKSLINQYGIDSVSVVNTEAKAATITVTLLNSSGVAIDFNTVLPQIERFELYTNVGPNNLVNGYSGIDKGSAAKNGKLDKAEIVDGKLVYTTNALPFGAANTDADTAMTFINWSMCSQDGKFVNCGTTSVSADPTKYTALKADLALATLSGAKPTPRHVDSVNFTSCVGCHGSEWQSQYHKGAFGIGMVMSEQLAHTKDANGNNIIGLDGCATCHAPAGTFKPSALEMKLHSKHADQAIVKDCAQCHNSFNFESFKHKTAIKTSAVGWTTPITATCTSCHTPESIGHGLDNMGAVVNGTKSNADAAAQSETCLFCHAPTITNHKQVKM